MDIPELSHPGTKNGPLTAGVITPLHTTTNVAAEALTENPMPPYKGTTPNQTPALVDNKNDLYGKLDIESVDSETDYPSRGVTDSSPENKHDAKGEEIPEDQKENSNTENIMEVIVTRGIRLSLTTDGGVQSGVEIYDYDKRGRYIYFTNRMWVSVDCTLIGNDTRLTVVKMLWTEKGIARHIDASSVVCTLIDNGKLANQIARLAAIVVKCSF